MKQVEFIIRIIAVFFFIRFYLLLLIMYAGLNPMS
jgi:hypothetical protein